MTNDAFHIDEDETVFLRTAREIGDRLVAEAGSADGGVSWHGDDLAGDSEQETTIIEGPVGPGLYSGAAGIAWFLACLGRPEESLYRETALAGIRHALQVGRSYPDGAAISLFSGSTGIALAALDVAERLGDQEVRGAAVSLARRTAKTLLRGDVPEESDLIGGLAGVVVGLLAIHHAAPETLFIEASHAACRALLQRRRQGWDGSCWPDPLSLERPGLCGMAHGASGIAWALMEAAQATGEASYRSAAGEAVLYERAKFSAQRCAWPDLRRSSFGDGGWMTAWCHGGLGIGAARLRMYELAGDRAALAEAGAAIHSARALIAAAASSLRAGHVSDVTVCHGLGGVTELMLLAYEIGRAQDHLRAARRVGQLCLDIHALNGRKWTCGLHGAKKVPGLYVGLAGIGATMLRLHDMRRMGSLLLPGRKGCSG